MTTGFLRRIALPEDILSYVRVSILGTLLASEVWSVNPVFDPTAEFGTTVNQSQLDAAALAIANRTIPTSMRTALSTSATRTGCRVEVRDDANDSLLAISTQGSVTPVSGTGVIAMPPQSAIVLSIRTDTPGGSGRGRLYWPTMGATLDGNGRIPAATATTFLADLKSYLLGIAATWQQRSHSLRSISL